MNVVSALSVSLLVPRQVTACKTTPCLITGCAVLLAVETELHALSLTQPAILSALQQIVKPSAAESDREIVVSLSTAPEEVSAMGREDTTVTQR